MWQNFFWAVFALVFVCANANPVKRQIYMFSGGCVVTGTKLYQNGVYVRDLTPSEQSEYSKYQQAMADWSQEFSAQMSQWSQNFANSMSNFNPFSNSNPAASSPPSPNPPPAPQQPSFCSANYGFNGGNGINASSIGSTGPTYFFNGCSVNNNRVYVNGQYARDLTNQEKTDLQTFEQQMAQWQKNQQQNMQKYQQQVQQAVANFNPLSGNGGNLNLPTLPVQNNFPRAPTICTTIG